MGFIILIIVLSITIFIPSLLIWGVGNLVFKIFKIDRRLTFWQSVVIYLTLFMIKNLIDKSVQSQNSKK